VLRESSVLQKAKAQIWGLVFEIDSDIGWNGTTKETLSKDFGL